MTDFSTGKAEEPASERYDTVVVGGGAAGLSAALFTARYGFDTLVLDRGLSAIRRSYNVENYLGLLGIDPETFLRLGRAHVQYEGGEVVDDLVTSVQETSEGFRVETQDGKTLTARYVVASSVYNADYLAGLRDGTFHEESDHPVECDEATGRTDIEGLYVAGWLSGGPHQVLISAGHGARVAKALIHDHRLAVEGYWDDVVQYWDWRVEEGAYGDEKWEGHVDDWIDERIDDALGDDRIERVRESIKEERLRFQLTEAERQRRFEDTVELLRRALIEEDTE